MFGWVNALIFGLFLALICFAWSKYQDNRILKVEIEDQAKTIKQQKKDNLELKSALDAERQAVETAQKTAKALQYKVETVQREIKSILAKEPCAVVELPVDVRNSIKRLHERNHD